ncbi:toll/interleukin-1 receptor domain-containing protein [Bacteroides faecalis]|uniref:TIR domain-containing protein n=1 Tax=Bacteroides faecalis TaxID=2447885 RepID=A0A401M1E0_9BACE|nr:TIR domain-containing protein [Bacteroides faecalis]GCB37474.1 hypothetical protein KGMB02408_44190 [Bacteroides faecalis]
MKYDLFISYRRTSFESANLIAEKLRSAGYSVFFDVETLRSGKFNEQLLTVIEHCKDFIIVLPENALDRCNDPEDWVRREVYHAMLHQKNIIPIMLTNFEWPDPMPQGMEELRNYQAISASSYEYFDLSMQRLTGYLISKPHKKYQKVLLQATVIVAILAVCAVIGYYSFRLMAIPVCTDTANTVTQGMGVINLLGETNQNLQKEWDKFCQKQHSTTNNPEKTDALKSDMIKAINHYQEEINKLQTQQPSPEFVTDNYKMFLLGLYDVNMTELTAFVQTYHSMFDDLNHQIEFLKGRMDDNDFSSLNLSMAKVNFEGFQYSMNSLYYGYLELLSLLPKESLNLYKQLSPHWGHFPNGIGTTLSKEEYQRFQENEMNKFEALIKDTEVKVAKTEGDLDELGQRLENLENTVKPQSGNEKKTTSENTNAESQLETRKEALKAKQQYVESQKKQLEELDKKYMETYQRMKEKCQLDEKDDQSYMWGKMLHWANFMTTIVDSRKQMEEKGVYSTSSITPELALADLNSLLSCYQTYHPEANIYLPAMKAFYKEVAQGKRPLAGVLVFGFKDDTVHPLLRAGDIIITRNETPIIKYEDLQKAIKVNKTGPVTFLRLSSDGVLKEHTENMPDTKILVGYMDLKE